MTAETVVYCNVVMNLDEFNISNNAKSWNKKLDQHFGANLKNLFLLNFATNLLLFAFFQLFNTKNTENEIVTSVWGAQHPNTGQNIQQLNF